MADQSTEKLFSIPAEMVKELEAGMKRLETLKNLAKDLKELGQDTTMMEADIKRIENQHTIMKRYLKEAKVTPTKLSK